MLGSKPAACWKNGRRVHPAGSGPELASMSLHMGLAVIEGLMAYPRPGKGHYLHRVKAHFERLLRGADALGFPCPYTVGQLILAAEKLLAELPCDQTYYIRPIVMRGDAHLWLTGIEEVPVDTALIAVPVSVGVNSSLRLCVVPVERVKSKAIPVSWKIAGTYVNSYLSRCDAARMGYDDGIMLDERGCLAEASAANVFVISQGQLLTPALRGSVFPGITRQHVLEIALRLGIAWQERDIDLEDLEQADGVFVSSTLLELRPVSTVDTLQFDSAEHPVFRRIRASFQQDTRGGENECQLA